MRKSSVYIFNNFVLDINNFHLKKDGVLLEIEPRVFDLLVYLVKNNKRVVTRNELFENVWGGRHVLDATLSNHIKLVRNILCDDGQAQKVIKTIHGRGYQFIAKIVDNSKSNNNKVKLQFSFIKSSLILLVTLVVLSLYFYSNNKPKQEKNYKSIVVLPFINTKPDKNTNYFSFAIADQIIGELAYFKNIAVRPSSAIRKYTNQNYDALAIGKDLEVDFVLSGSYLKINDTVRLTVELVNVNSKQLIWRGKPLSINDKSAFELQDIVAQSVVKGLKIEFSTIEIKRTRQDISSNPLAYEYYLRSVAYPYTTDGNKLAIEMLKKSIELDPSYALSYVQFGDRIRRFKQFGLVELDELKSAEFYYLKALELNPDLISALSFLALLYTETNRIDTAIVLARNMQAINPHHATTHFTMGYIYRYTGLVSQAINEMEQAVKIDPHNLKFRSLIGTYSGAGKLYKALKLTDNYPESPFTLGWKGLIYRRLGDNEKALDYFNKVLEIDEDGLWSNVVMVFIAYMQNSYEKGFDAIKKLNTTKVTDAETMYFISSYYGLLGDKENCINMLTKAIRSGYFNYPFMQMNPYFDNFKNDVDFKNVIKFAKSKHLDFKERY